MYKTNTTNGVEFSIFDTLFAPPIGLESYFNESYEIKNNLGFVSNANKDKKVFQLAFPGSKKENFKLSIQGRSVKVDHKVEKPTELNCNRAETLYFESRYNLDKVEAVYDNGILTVFAPIKEESKPKTIEVK